MANTKKRPPNRPPNRKLTPAQIASREAKRKREQRRRILAAVVIVAVIAGIVVGFVVTGKGKNQTAAPIAADTDPNVKCTPDQKFDDITTGNGHTTSKVKYEVNPPSGGDHNPSPAAPGIYSEGGSPGDEHIVHSMEHGYVTIWYNPDSIDTAALAKIENIWKNYKKDVLVVERRSLAHSLPVVATAWHNRLLCSGADDAQ